MIREMGARKHLVPADSFYWAPVLRPICLTVGVLVLIVGLGRCSETPGVDLADRIKTSDPAWSNYQEDIKAQIGARPVARWQGAPAAVECTGKRIRVTFKVSGPWAGKQPNLPVMMRGPRGDTRVNSHVELENGSTVYVFHPGDGEAFALPIPWLELKYPNGAKRVTLSQGGTWSAQKTD